MWAADDAARDAAIDAVAGPRRPCWRRLGRRRRRATARLVAAGLRADLFGRASRRAEGAQRLGRRCRSRSLPPIHRAAAIAAIEPCAERRAGRGGGSKAKLLSVLRLAKASATYAGGAEYIAWKINRHAGTEIELKPWQRRHGRCWRRSACCRGSSGPARFARPAGPARPQPRWPARPR